jgi:hypothetical protein
MLQERMSCSASLATPPDCTGTRAMAVKDRKGAVVIAASLEVTAESTTRFGPQLRVRARCVPCDACVNGKRILVEVAATGGGDAKPRGAEDWQDLYGGLPLDCIVP